MTPPNAQVIVPDGSAVITPNDMFNEVRATHDEVKTLTTKVDTLSTNVGNRLESLEREAADHETRLRELERKLYRWAGGAAVVGAALGVLAQRLPLW